MLTKTQKKEHVADAKKMLSASKSIVLTDFTGLPTEMLKKLKKSLKATGGSYKVFKKRLTKIAFAETGMTMDPTVFPGQVGIAFLKGDLTTAAAAIYAFQKQMTKEKKEFVILGAYDLEAKREVSKEEFMVIAKLPSREVLLGQVLGAFTAPLRAFMYLLNELSKRGNFQQDVVGEKVAQ